MPAQKIKFTWWTTVLENVGLRQPSLGRRGERFAGKYLRKQGMKILAFNRTLPGGGRGEIDLIAIDGKFLVFIEVRTRSSEQFITPENTIRRHKQKTLRTTITKLIRKHGRAELTPRLDVIAIHWPKKAKAPTDVRHYKNAFPLTNW